MDDVFVRTYLGFGLVIHSEIPLPGAVLGNSGLAPNITIAKAPVPEPPTVGVFRQSEGIVHGSHDGIARFACAKGGRVDVELAASSDVEATGKLLIASALPATLWLRDEIVLHAAVAVIGAGAHAIGIAGGSGEGKSTVLSQLLQRNARIVADDAARLTRAPQRWTAAGLPGGYFAPADEGAILGERAFVPVAPDQRQQSASLCALFELARGTETEPARFDRLEGADALAALLRARHRAVVPRLLGTEAHHLNEFIALSREVSVYRWTRPEGTVALAEEEYDQLRTLCDTATVKGMT